jgi:argininosuccinate lyase
LNDLSLEEFKSFSPLIEDDVFSALTLAATLRSKSQIGGTAPARVAAALSEARKRLAAD